MPIIPDTKNWTWVIEKPCPECGFDASSFDATDVARNMRENAGLWPAVLSRPDVRDRPNDETWSALEYAAHVRDVLRIFHTRITLMLTKENPLFANWDQDATAVAERYNEQDPDAIAEEIGEAADALASLLESVHGADWQRVGRRSDGASFTVESIAKYLAHDPNHHAWDVGAA
jgi:hypothetical protein